MQSFADSFPEHVDGRVGLHDLVHSLQSQRLDAWEPIAKGRMHIIGQIHGNNQTSGRRIYGYVIRRIIQELRPGIPLNIMRIKVSPSQLHINPVLV